MIRHSPRRPRPHAVLAAALAALALSLAAYSCTPETQHAWLTTFFDGVPSLHPEPKRELVKPATATTAAEQPKPAAIVWSEHKPTLDVRKCGACHDRDASFALLRPIKDLCLQCHQAKATEFPMMHGPAAVGDCSQCHEPHRSPFPHLLKIQPPKLCFRCHEPAPPGGRTLGCPRASDEAVCTTCHSPHGGTNRFFVHGRH